MVLLSSMVKTQNKTCSRCKRSKEVQEFQGENRLCDICLEQCKKYREDNDEKIKQREKEYRMNNQEQIAQKKREYRHEHRDRINARNRENLARIKDDIFTCPVCNYDIKKYKKAQHEKSLAHKYYSEKKLNNEEPEQPDKIQILCGKEHFHCATCNVNTLPCMWVAHLFDKFHIEKKKAT